MPRSRKRTLNEIPATGSLDPTDYTHAQGICHRCEGSPTKSQLRRHCIDCHINGKKAVSPKCNVIPATGPVDRDNLSTGRGICNRCPIPKAHNRLQQHYDSIHVNGWKPRPKKQKVVTIADTGITKIPNDGNVDPDKVTTGLGTCEMDGCDSNVLVRNLQLHLRTTHLQENQPCPECGQNVAIHAGSLEDHMLTHSGLSGPAKCSECSFIMASLGSVRQHKHREHFTFTGDVYGILLEGAELQAYLDEKAAQQERSREVRERGVWYLNVSIPKPRATQKEYAKLLATSSHILQTRSMVLYDKFTRLFGSSSSRRIIKHASFVTQWNDDNKIPHLVLQLIVKRTTKDYFKSSSFFPDPNLDENLQAKTNTFVGTGLERLHMAAAGNFEEMMMVVPTYFYTNVFPGTPELNVVMLALEMYLRKRAKKSASGIWVWMFPIVTNHFAPRYVGGIRIPNYLGVVMMEETPTGVNLSAWELFNGRNPPPYQECACDPFKLMEDAGITFLLDRTFFQTVSTRSYR